MTTSKEQRKLNKIKLEFINVNVVSNDLLTI